MLIFFFFPLAAYYTLRGDFHLFFIPLKKCNLVFCCVFFFFFLEAQFRFSMGGLFEQQNSWNFLVKETLSVYINMLVCAFAL